MFRSRKFGTGGEGEGEYPGVKRERRSFDGGACRKRTWGETKAFKQGKCGDDGGRGNIRGGGDSNCKRVSKDLSSKILLTSPGGKLITERAYTQKARR